jgi:hypothetical protein
LFLMVLGAPVMVGAGLIGLGVGHKTGPAGAADTQIENQCPWGDFAPILKQLEGSGGASPIVLGFFHRGPEIMYRTGTRVVGTPYHRNASGIRDTHLILTTDAPDDARGIAQRRGVDYLAFCRNAPESHYSRTLTKN